MFTLLCRGNVVILLLPAWLRLYRSAIRPIFWLLAGTWQLAGSPHLLVLSRTSFYQVLWHVFHLSITCACCMFALSPALATPVVLGVLIWLTCSVYRPCDRSHVINHVALNNSANLFTFTSDVFERESTHSAVTFGETYSLEIVLWQDGDSGVGES